MSKPGTGKNQNETSLEEEARERELQELIERAEKKKSGELPPQKESPHDYVERTMREKAKK